MKRITVLLLLAMISMSAGLQKAYAQTDRMNVVTINPLSLVVSNISMFYERKINNVCSAKLGLSYMDVKIGVDPAKIDFSGFAITPEFRYYLTNAKVDVPGGFYVGPWIRIRSLTATAPGVDSMGSPVTDKFNVTQFAAGAIAGYQKVFDSGFTLDFFGGPFYNSNSYSLVSGGTNATLNFGQLGSTGIGFRFGIGVGYAF